VVGRVVSRVGKVCRAPKQPPPSTPKGTVMSCFTVRVVANEIRCRLCSTLSINKTSSCVRGCTAETFSFRLKHSTTGPPTYVTVLETGEELCTRSSRLKPMRQCSSVSNGHGCTVVWLPCSAALPCSWRPGGASLLWAQCALQSLSSDLVSRYGAGAGLVYKPGPYTQALTEVGPSRV